MKKLLTVLMAALMLVFAAPSLMACSDDTPVLRIHNWGEYMDPGVINGFADWYLQETGEKIKVKYTEFSVNENMFNDIDVKHSEYDLVCPSDYMAEKMIDGNYAKKINKDIVNFDNMIREDLLDLTKIYDPTGEYTVPYMWGTLGIMYDVTKVTTAEAARMNSWEVLFDSTFSKKLLMKNSIRDAFVIANIYNNIDTLSGLTNGFESYDNPLYREELDKIFSDVSQKTIEDVEKTLKDQKKDVIKYEVDDGKDDMMVGNTNAKLGLFWSCDAGYVMNDIELEGIGCCAGTTMKGNKNLRYVVPKEGSNVWVDCWLIPKFSKNETAANYFLKYLCEPKQAMANMAYVGSASPITEVMEDYKKELLESDFFDDAESDFKNMYLDMMFPSEETLKRCSVMKNFGSENSKIEEMWLRVKAN